MSWLPADTIVGHGPGQACCASCAKYLPCESACVGQALRWQDSWGAIAPAAPPSGGWLPNTFAPGEFPGVARVGESRPPNGNGASAAWADHAAFKILAALAALVVVVRAVR